MKSLYPTRLLFFCFWAVSITISAFGQQVPYFSIYSNQPAFINPAAQGGADGGNVGIAYRSQFSDLPKKDRPLSYLLHADLSPFVGGLSDRIGVGLMVMQDQVHVAKRLTANGFFAYHLFPEENDFHLSLGVMAGVINQHFDFTNTRVSNPNDLALLRGVESKTRFDGGLGIQAKYLQGEGSNILLDVTLPQLFTSDLSFKQDTTGRSVRYDLLPHALASLRYHWQGPGFAIEPNVVYRESFGKKLKKGNFDFNLRAYFLDDDRIMVGAGYRLHNGGLLFSIGFKPIAQLNISAAYENHSALGSTIELGVQYAFAGSHGPCRPGPNEADMEDHSLKAKDAQQLAASLSASTREKINLANAALVEAKNTTNYQIRQTKLENADKLIAQALELQVKLRTEMQKVVQAQERGDNLITQMANNKHKLCNANLIDQIHADYNEVRVLENEVATKLTETKITRSGIQALLNVNDPAALQNYVSSELKNLSSKPDELKVLRVSATTIEFEYPDVDEVYVSAASRSFADFLARIADDMKKQGAVVESVRMVEEILYEKIDTRVDAKYKGEYGDPLKMNYKLNFKDRNPSPLKKEAALTLESLAALKMTDMKRGLSTKMGLPEDKIMLSITAPNKNNEYTMVTKITLNYKKQ